MLLRPSKFHRHRGGWLPSNQHHHRGVLQCSQRSFWALFPKKSQNCPSRLQSRESSKCHVIWSRVNVAGARERTTVSRSCRHRPPSPVRRPLPHSQTTIHCWDSRDSLGTVLSETVTTVSLSAPPTVPCSEQLAHSRTDGMIWIWKPRHPPVSN